jgi:hypothetical protein
MFQQERAFAFLAAAGQCVRTRQRHQHRLLKQPVDNEPFLIGMGRSDEGDVNLFASQQFEQFPAEALPISRIPADRLHETHEWHAALTDEMDSRAQSRC